MKSKISDLEQGRSTGREPPSTPDRPDQPQPLEHLRRQDPEIADASVGSGAPLPRILFQEPLVEKLPISKIPPGWQVLKDGMALGNQPGSIVFSDGTMYGPQSIDLGIEAYERPIWRFCTKEGAAKPQKGMIPVLQAYDALSAALADEPAALSEWS